MTILINKITNNNQKIDKIIEFLQKFKKIKMYKNTDIQENVNQLNNNNDLENMIII